MLVGLAVVSSVQMPSVVGDPGARVGLVVAALLLVGLAAAVWPYRWRPEELEHHELEAIWRELRSDADRAVPWERYAAWAEARDGSLDLLRLSCAATTDRVAGAPSPFASQVVRRLESDDVDAAAQAMEELRAELAELEGRAEQRHKEESEEADRLAHEQVLREIDHAAAAQVKANERQLDREIAQQEAAERRTQAEAVAKALRRS